MKPELSFNFDQKFLTGTMADCPTWIRKKLEINLFPDLPRHELFFASYNSDFGNQLWMSVAIKFYYRKELIAEYSFTDPYGDLVPEGYFPNFRPARSPSASPGQMVFTFNNVEVPTLRLDLFARADTVILEIADFKNLMATPDAALAMVGFCVRSHLENFIP